MANKPGRPPLDPTSRSVAVMLKVPARTFDAYCRRASAARLSVPEFLRRALNTLERKDIQTSGK